MKITKKFMSKIFGGGGDPGNHPLKYGPDHNPDFEVTVLGKRLLYNNDRILYPVYRLVAVLMTLK